MGRVGRVCAVALAGMLAIVPVAGCGKKAEEAGRGGAGRVPDAREAAPPGPGALVIRGIRLGMKIDDVPAALKGAGVDISDGKGGEYAVEAAPGRYVFTDTDDVVVLADRGKSVYQATFFRTLFDAADLTPEAFAEEVRRAYSLPALSPTEAGWYYQDPSGYRLWILRDKKKVRLESIAAAAEGGSR